MNNHGSIQVGDATIAYEVVRSARRHKTFQTKVSLDNVRVLAPADASDLEVEQLIRKQGRRILERRRILGERPAPRRFVTGETMPYLGRDFELIVDTDRFLRPWIRFDEDCFLFDAPPDMDDEKRRELIRKAFVDWYWRQAEEDLPAWVDDWLPFVAAHAKPRVLVRDQRRRWASCAYDRTLRFNWRTMMLEPDLIDYLVVHELAHVTEMNHSKQFWDLVAYQLPDVNELRQRLREVERLLPL
ncbi:MAG: SprT family zinc-dependent metalloprotease [bacterium]|nr:SprT family zinc-dependent metalloprotease [bacterium]MDE0601090.1 SprT family zinc-dependent metalloprotease [bacterium]